MQTKTITLYREGGDPIRVQVPVNGTPEGHGCNPDPDRRVSVPDPDTENDTITHLVSLNP